jgi:hypothetical protein
MCIQSNTEARSGNLSCSRKTISITYSECGCVALVIQHEMRMCCIILSSVACPIPPFFPPHYPIKARLSKNVTVSETRVVIFSTTFV